MLCIHMFIGNADLASVAQHADLQCNCGCQGNAGTVPLAIQRQIFNVAVPVVLLALCALFWALW